MVSAIFANSLFKSGAAHADSEAQKDLQNVIMYKRQIHFIDVSVNVLQVAENIQNGGKLT